MRNGYFSLILSSLCFCLSACDDYGGRPTPSGSVPKPAAEELTLVGLSNNHDPWDPGVWVFWSWSRKQGWDQIIAYPEHWKTSTWRAPTWQVYSFNPADPTMAETTPMMDSVAAPAGHPRYAHESQFPDEVLMVSGFERRQLRPFQLVDRNRPDLAEATRELCRRAGVAPPQVPRIVLAYEADLDGDGDKELVWVAESAQSTAYSVFYRPDEYALVGLRKRGKLVTLMAATAHTKSHERPHYKLQPPVDIDEDGVMEVSVYTYKSGMADGELRIFRLTKV